MKNKKPCYRIALCFFSALIFFCTLPLGAETFVFKEKKGSMQRTISTSNEEVFINGELQYKTKILNRMTSEVTDYKNSTAQFKAVFTLAEEHFSTDTTSGEQSAPTFQWSEEYKSVFSRTNLGKLTIGKNVVMPTIRDVPLFPQRDIKVGESWTAPGMEVHDLSNSFPIKELFKIPFVAKYTYLGDKTWRGKTYKAISITYNAEQGTDQYFEDDPRNTMLLKPVDVYKPVKVVVYSNQIMLWDIELGQPVAAEDQFQIAFKMSDGTVYEFRGTAESEIIESEQMDKEDVLHDLEQKIKDAGIENATVKVVDDGVSISIENIQFGADSAFLENSEKEKLDKLGIILRTYPNRDILVNGHAALAGGTEESRLKLSQERAGAVAAYLIKNNVRTKEHVMVRGWGSSKPVADNRSDAGRQKNRRVEITILEN
ncbi:MAG: OmpA family protein [Spirochaetaceae bacterium]|jgi:outer membrane protein OmpA-like peptidoglycan-associated protein|nr:OmpA family protein [Spirochaetaceae bacterium]